MPNPWPPDDVVRLIRLAVSTADLASVVYKLLAIWIEDRKARSIKIKQGEVEMEIHGGTSEKELERAFNKFRGLLEKHNSTDGKLDIILPNDVDRTVTQEQVRASRETTKKGSKK
jgi:hypothetical protein